MSNEDATIRTAIAQIPVIGTAVNLIASFGGGGVFGGETEQEIYNRAWLAAYLKRFYKPKDYQKRAKRFGRGRF
jgi:hypothetical protein